jgi:hypothetical protein
MLTEFKVDPKNQECTLTFQFSNFTSPASYQNALSLIFIVCADFQLDPELEMADFEEIIQASKESGKDAITFFISEEGLEAQAT